MKRSLGIALLGGILLAGLVWFFVKGRSHKGPPIPIPAYADKVIVLDLDQLTKIFVKDYLFHGDAYTALAENSFSDQESGALSSPLEMGLQVKGELWIYGFTSQTDAPQQVWALPVRIQNRSDFEGWIRQEVEARSLTLDSTEEHFWTYSPQHQVGIMWDGETAVALQGLGQQLFTEEANRLLISKTSDKSPHPDQQQIKQTRALLTIWAQIDSVGTVAQTFDFSQGEIQQTVELIPLASYQGNLALGEPKAEQKGYVHLKTNLAPEWVQTLSESGFEKESIGFLNKLLPNLKTWNGQVEVSVGDWEIIQQSYTSYEYDEEFNRVPVTQFRESLFPQFSLQFRMQTPAQVSQQIANWQEKGMLQQQAKTNEYIISPDSSYQLSLLTEQNLLWLQSASLNYPVFTLDENGFSHQGKKEALSLYIDWQKWGKSLPPEAQDWKWLQTAATQWEQTRLNVWEEAGRLKGVGKWTFADKDRNALPQLLLWAAPQISLPL